MKEILKTPDPILSKKCTPVTDFRDAEHISQELTAIMKYLSKWWNRWLGFAANQIGYDSRIIGLRDGSSNYMILINPSFVTKRIPFPYFEKCYSLSSMDQVWMVKRYLWSKVKFQDINGTWSEKSFLGFSAIYQEMDHIDGIMISDIGKRIF